MNAWIRLVLLGVLAAAIVACGDDGAGGDDDDDDDDDITDGGVAGDDDDDAPAFTLTSSAFAEGDTIPLRHECGDPFPNGGPGENITPELTWTAGPEGTESYAIVMRDRDAGDLVHWIIYDIPGAALGLDEGVPAGFEPAFPAGARQGQIQGSGFFGYFGPCSPTRVNTYEWTLYAVDPASLADDIGMSASEAAASGIIELNALASATLSGES